MKNLKILMVALALLALPAVAFGQVRVSCDDCTHHASVFMGEGGLVATFDSSKNPKATKVSWLAVCDGVKQFGALTPNDDGMVAMLFDMDNGYACNADDGTFEIGPITDGGWFWVTDDMNSAVGSLVNDDILGNATTEITSAGSGVTMTEGAGAVFLKETASGRVGILPTILATKTVAMCGYDGTTEKVTKTECTLGDGKTKLVASAGWVDPVTGQSAPFVDEGSVRRPATGDVEITFRLYLASGPGHYSVSDDTPTLGLDTPLTVSAFTAKVGTTDLSNTTHGASIATSDNVGTLTIGQNTDYCDSSSTPKKDNTLTVKVGAPPGDADEMVPDVKAPAAAFTVKIMCPLASSSSSLGVELVPENPFPTD